MRSIEYTGVSTRLLLFSGFFLFLICPALAQVLEVVDIFSGNPYGSKNTSTYDWQVYEREINTRTGSLLISVEPVKKTDCARDYLVTWSFSKDISILKIGDNFDIEVRVSVKEEDTACNRSDWDYSDQCPIVVDVMEDAHVSGIRAVSEYMIDQSAFDFDNVFSVVPKISVFSDAKRIRMPNTFLGEGKTSIHVGGQARLDQAFTRHAKGGAFAIRLNARGINWHVVYLFKKSAHIPTPEGLSAQLSLPEVTQKRSDGLYWLGIKVPGHIWNAEGKTAKLIVRFLDEKGEYLRADPLEKIYIDGSGFVATYSSPIPLDNNAYALDRTMLWIPHHALNLGDAGQETHTVFAMAEVYSNDKLLATSDMSAVRITW